MKIRICLMLSLVFITMYVFTSCSQDDIIANTDNENLNDGVTRAVSDIFNVEAINVPDVGSLWGDNPRGVDNKGNFYFISTNPFSEEVVYIYKYDVEMDELVPLAPLGFNAVEPCCQRFLFDENNNLCHLIYNYITGKSGIRRVRADGNAVIEQWLDFSVSSMCTAPNGNIFLLASSSEDACIYKFSSNGVLSKVEADLSGINGNCQNIYKASGATIYMYSSNWYSSYWYKINTNTGSVEEQNIRVDHRSSDSRLFASSATKANLYTIKDNYVLQLRPNAASDLVIGTIPNSYKNKEGQFVNMDYYPELYVNSDANIFYTLGTEVGFYKLTLP